MPPRISVIVTSYTVDRLADIQDLLRSLQQQTSHEFEVVYVVERSEVLSKSVRSILAKSNFESLTVFNSGKLGLPEARNLGVERASGDIIGFVDDDVVLDRNWCRAVAEGFENMRGIEGATGPAFPIWRIQPITWLPPQLDWLIGCTRWMPEAGATEVGNVWGMNMCFWRETIRKQGGFLPGLGMLAGHTVGWLGEDVELSKRIRSSGGKLYFLPEMKVYSKVDAYKLSSRYVIERSVRVGYDRGSIVNLAELLTNGQESLAIKALLYQFFVAPAHIQTLRHLRSFYMVSFLALFGLSMGFLICRLGLGRYSHPKRETSSRNVTS